MVDWATKLGEIDKVFDEIANYPLEIRKPDKKYFVSAENAIASNGSPKNHTEMPYNCPAS